MLGSTQRAHILEFAILHNPTWEGPMIGKLGGCEFSEFVRDEFGRQFVYSGAAPRLPNGQFDAKALGEGEFIVMPGLIYKYRARRKSGTWRPSLVGLTS